MPITQFSIIIVSLSRTPSREKKNTCTVCSGPFLYFSPPPSPANAIDAMKFQTIYHFPYSWVKLNFQCRGRGSWRAIASVQFFFARPPKPVPHLFVFFQIIAPSPLYTTHAENKNKCRCRVQGWSKLNPPVISVSRGSLYFVSQESTPPANFYPALQGV